MNTPRFQLDNKYVPSLAGNPVLGWSVLDNVTRRWVGPFTMRCTAQVRLERLEANPDYAINFPRY